MGGLMRLLLLVAVVASVVWPAPVVRTLRHEVPCRPGQVVSINHRYGSIDVAGHAGESLAVVAVARVDGADRQAVKLFAVGIDLSIASWAETAYVSILYPSLPEPSSKLSYEVDISIRLPRAVRLEVRNSFGDVEVTGLKAGCRVESRFGDVVLDGCSDCDVQSRYGDVYVACLTGLLTVNNSYGSVFLDRVSEQVRVTNYYGSVEGNDMDGDVHLVNVLGNIVARGGRGQLVLVNRYGDIDAWVEDSGLAELEVQAELGRVELNLARTTPFQLGGRTVEGLIRAGLPFQVRQEGPMRWVSGQAGSGGPRIQFTGAWADFFIGPDSVLESASGGKPGTSAGDGR